MYLENLNTFYDIAGKSQFSIFIAPKPTFATLPITKNTIPIPPNDKNTHDIETIRSIEQLTRTKQQHPQIFLIQDADQLTLAASNAFLKLLEEPNDNISFVFLAKHISSFLPAVISRARVYYLKSGKTTPSSDITDLAKKLIASNSRTVIPLATQLAKDRAKTLEVVNAAIDILYKSYLATGNHKFPPKLKKFLDLHFALQKSGHIKLHVVNSVC